jgi:hypothetical protein
MTSPATSTRVRERLRGIDGVLALLSAVALPLGLAVILLGWYGAAHSSYLFEQIPYLISGGLFGLGLVFVGGLVYFGSMLARNAAQQQRQGEQIVELLRELRDGMTAPVPAPKGRASRNGGGEFVATAKGGMLHRPDCAVVAGREDLRAVSATGQGLAPCSLCTPFDVDLSPSQHA